MSAPCDGLVLDFGGVITRTVFESHRETERVLGLASGTLKWMGPFDPASDALWRSMQADEISERDYWRIRAREVGEFVGENWDSLPKFLQRIRGDDPSAAIRPEALAAIHSAKAGGKKIAILSNELDLFYSPGFRTKLPFLATFDAIVDATHTKIIKPDPRAYALVTEALGISPSACVFVDDQKRNVRGAADIGMKAVHFDVRAPGESFARALALLGIKSAVEAQ